MKGELEKTASSNAIDDKEAISEIANKLSNYLFPDAHVEVRLEKKNTDTFLLQVLLTKETTQASDLALWEIKSRLASSVAKEALYLFQFGAKRNLDEVVILIRQPAVKSSVPAKKFPSKDDLETIDLFKIRLHRAGVESITSWRAVPFDDKHLGPKDYETLKSVVDVWTVEIDNFERLVIHEK